MPNSEKKLNRSLVRAYVQKQMDEHGIAGERGEIVYQLSLDQSDYFNEILASLSPEDAIALMNIYTEELEAWAQMMNEKNRIRQAETDRIISETDRFVAETTARVESADKLAENLAKILGGIIAIIIAYFMIAA